MVWAYSSKELAVGGGWLEGGPFFNGVVKQRRISRHDFVFILFGLDGG